MRERDLKQIALLGALVVAFQHGCTAATDGSTDPGGGTTPAAITAVSPTSQTGIAGGAVATPPSIKVTNASGSALAGVIVTFAVASGGGSVSGATQNTSATGTAAVGSWTLGTLSGDNALTVTVSGIAPLSFSATGAAGPPTKIIMTTPPSATAQNRIVFAVQPTFQLQDAHGNAAAKSGVDIAASIATGGGIV